MTETGIDTHVLAFPVPRTVPFFPPDVYHRLREQAPVTRVNLPTGKQAWLVTRYQDVRALLADPRVSSDIRRPNFPAMGKGEQEVGSRTRPFIRTDPPEHTRYRRMLQAEFTVRRVRDMRPAVQRIVDGCVDRLLAGDQPADFVPGFANAVSTSTVLELFGAPTGDLEFFRDVTRVSGGRGSTAQEVSDALGRMFGVLDGLISEREREPGEDLLSKLVTNHLATGAVTRQELLSTVGITIIAGRETTTNMIALGTLLLLQEPETVAALRKDRSLLPLAVEELLRALSVGDSLPLRVATEDIEVGGVTIWAGEGLILLLGAANHDPEAFRQPQRIDLTRTDGHHFAFGHGIHQCLGQHLARLELEIAYGTLLDRVPGLALAVPFDELVFKHEAATFGVESMPVRW